MVTKNLVTTRLETDSNSNNPNLYLGRWAIKYKNENDSNEINNYHWDDRNQLFIDYKKIQDLYEYLLPVLSDSLNQLHKTKKSYRYWRILIGPWLGIWLQIMIDRWKSIDSLDDVSNNLETFILDYSSYELSSHDTQDFMQMSSTEEFNHVIYSKIIKFKNLINYIELSKKIYNINNDQITKFDLIKYFIKNTICNVINLFSLNNKVVFIDTYLRLIDKWKLEISLLQIPTLLKNKVSTIQCKDDKNLRNTIKIKYVAKDRFEEFVMQNIMDMIPRNFIESYQINIQQVNKLLWPKKPKVLISAVLIQNDLQKLWVAEKVEKGSKLILEQHGGHYGVGKFSFTESHEIEISDSYLSWGWNNGNEKVKKIAHPKLRSNISRNPEGGICQILMSLPRYSYRMYSVPVASQVYEYSLAQLDFSNSLEPYLRKKLTVKLHPTERGYDLKKRYEDNFPKITLGDSNNNIYDEIANNKIIVCTYNATTILECLSANIPTVMFWNFKHWELNSHAESFYNQLHAVNILHDGPISAAKFINSNWDNIESWWHSAEVQKVVINFSSQYAYTNKNWKNGWVEVAKDHY